MAASASLALATVVKVWSFFVSRPAWSTMVKLYLYLVSKSRGSSAVQVDPSGLLVPGTGLPPAPGTSTTSLTTPLTAFTDGRKAGLTPLAPSVGVTPSSTAFTTGAARPATLRIGAADSEGRSLSAQTGLVAAPIPPAPTARQTPATASIFPVLRPVFRPVFRPVPPPPRVFRALHSAIGLSPNSPNCKSSTSRAAQFAYCAQGMFQSP